MKKKHTHKFVNVFYLEIRVNLYMTCLVAWTRVRVVFGTFRVVHMRLFHCATLRRNSESEGK